MSEDVARAVGARIPEPVTIAGKEVLVRPLSLKELTEAQRAGLKDYKRSYLETYKENLDLLPESEQSSLMREKLEEVARWDLQDLPAKLVYDVKRVKINPAIEKWVKENYPEYEVDPKASKEKQEAHLKAVVTTALDSEVLADELYENLTGESPKKHKVGYVNWWITATFEGMLTMLWLSIRDSGLTKDQIAGELSKNPGLLAQLSREIESLSAPATSNG